MENNLDEQIELLQLLKVEMEKFIDFIKGVPLKLETSLEEAKSAGMILQHYDNLKGLLNSTSSEIDSLCNELENRDIAEVDYSISKIEQLY